MKLLYLSGAPRVSTKLSSNAGGARAHILGVINGFKSLDWEVDEFIVGDRIFKNGNSADFQKSLSKSFVKRLAADLIRIVLGIYHSIVSYSAYKDVSCVYERLGAFQFLGIRFKKKRIPWILETNSILYLEAKNDRKSIILTGICKYIETKAYQNCDYLICVTDELKNMILQKFDIDESKVIVVPNGVDTDRFNPQKVKRIREFDEFTVGFIGSVIAWSGVDILLKAIKVVKEELPIKATIVGDGLAMSGWLELANKLGLDDDVTFVGRKSWDQIPSYIAGFDICYSGQVPTKSGKMYHSPLKIYEYLSMGKPVLAARFQDAQSVIKDGENGFCFKSGDVEDLVEKLKLAYSLFLENRFDETKIRKQVERDHSWKSRVKYILNNVC